MALLSASPRESRLRGGSRKQESGTKATGVEDFSHEVLRCCNVRTHEAAVAQLTALGGLGLA